MDELLREAGRQHHSPGTPRAMPEKPNQQPGEPPGTRDLCPPRHGPREEVDPRERLCAADTRKPRVKRTAAGPHQGAVAQGVQRGMEGS